MQPGRVIEVQRVHQRVQLADGSVVLATVRGEFHEAGEYPKVGDYVQVSLLDVSEEAQAVIEVLQPRTSVITRYDETTGLTQVLVANVDLLLIVMGLDGDYNLARLERYLALAQQCGIAPVVVLNKADLASDLSQQVQQVQEVAGAVPVHTVTATTGEGLAAVTRHIAPGATAVLLGSSGAGKSTITNYLLGEAHQATSAVRADDSRGRHTTTTRHLFTLPSGGYLIDTPGIRELALAATGRDEDVVVAVEQLAHQCQFRNCDHEKSAGCAVQEAIAAGDLPTHTLHTYHKLQRERAWQQDRSEGGKRRFVEQRKKRSAQAQAAADRKRRLRGG